MPRKPTTVRIGRDSKGAYIKYGRQKIYISKSVQQRLASIGRESLTEFLVKWIVKHFTRRRRRRRDRKANVEYKSAPESVATALSDPKLKQLPLEAQRTQLVALSLLNRPAEEQRRALTSSTEGLRREVRRLTEGKRGQKLIESSQEQRPRADEEELTLPDGKEVIVRKESIPAIMRNWNSARKKGRTAIAQAAEAKQEAKAKEQQSVQAKLQAAQAEKKAAELKLVNFYATLGGFPYQDAPNSLTAQINSLGHTRGSGKEGTVKKLVNIMVAVKNDKNHPLRDKVEQLDFYKKSSELYDPLIQVEKNIKEIRTEGKAKYPDVFASPGASEADDEDLSEASGEYSPVEPDSHVPLHTGRRVQSDDDEAEAGAGGGGVAGTGLRSRTEALTDEQIDDLMSDIPGYLGAICKDEIPGLTEDATMAWNAGRPFGFITLTLTRAQATGSEFSLRPKDIATADDLGPVVKERKKALKRPADIGHWVAVACIPDTQQLAYYDSFGVPAPADIKVALKDMFDKIAPRTLLKFKENLIQEQSVDTDNCGWFCIQFLLDMFHGRKFTEATPYNKVLASERNNEQFKKKFKPFSWL